MRPQRVPAISDRVNFSCTALTGTNKVGNLKRDANGYYEVVLGALDVFNHSGQFWPHDTSAREIFQKSSSFMRRIARAALRAEYGHPKRDGMSIMDFANRLTVIDERMVCCHIAEVWLDTSRVKDPSGKVVIAIMGKIRPNGPYGHVLEQQLQNPLENVCFSIRAVTTDNMIRGRYEKSLREIITWDYVNEGGIAAANKYSVPSLESLNDMAVPVEMLHDHVQRLRLASSNGIAMESDSSMLSSILDAVRQQPTVGITQPRSANW